MTQKAIQLLIVEDDSGLQNQLKWAFSQYAPHIVGTREAALAAVNRYEPPVVVLDLGLPPDPDGASEGLATLEAILEAAPDTKVIIASGNEQRENAVRAVALGAYDFYQKPIDVEILGLIISRALRLSQLEAENRRLQSANSTAPFHGIVTGDPEMYKICRSIEKVAGTDVTVLILGESGTGKELLARAVHNQSTRAGRPFVAINCAAIPETLLESELFGHERGAFTGAVKQTLGKIEIANKGSLFLDEIGDLPLPLQVKLLRFLQDRVIERIGGRQAIPVDVRIICATNQDLAKLMVAGRFREDLFYRLNEFMITVPPLRDRPNDALLLAHYFLNKFGVSLGRSVRGFTKEAAAAIAGHNWPGNVRELENCIKRSVIMSEGKLIDLRDLDLKPAEADEGGLTTLKQARERAERAMIQRALVETQSNISLAAKLLGVSRPTLYDLMKEYDLKQ
ncbi:MAG TPA: PEP-CTERM-box response regulator transcription factor [Stellaceae bacterium]|nr:PEP-CTERM-box response regulator transcription factor [Stellaceae bacterium]